MRIPNRDASSCDFTPGVLAISLRPFSIMYHDNSLTFLFTIAFSAHSSSVLSNSAIKFSNSWTALSATFLQLRASTSEV